MDLRSGETVWRLKHGPPRRHPSLAQDARCEVAVIGGGITGALIAHDLVRAGLDCVLFDKGEIGGGSTSASTALLSYELDTPLWKLAEQIGEADAAASYRACFEAIGNLEEVVQRLGNSAHFIRRPSIYLAEEPHQVPELEREWALRRKHGMEVDLWPAEEI